MTEAAGGLGELLRAAAARSMAALSQALAPQGITAAEYALLRALHQSGAVAPSALADTMGITRGAVTKLVDRLRAKRLLVRAAAGRADRRYQTIALTGAGASLMPTLARLADAAERASFARLTPQARAALALSLQEIAGKRAERAARGEGHDDVLAQ